MATGETALAPIVFRDCAALVSVDLPEGLSELPDESFAGCTALRSVQFLGDAPSAYAAAYADAPAELVTYVADGTRGWDGIETSRNLPEAWPAGAANAIATWTPTRLGVTFDARGGEPAETVLEETVGTTYRLPQPDPSRLGATFLGWWTETDAGAEVRPTTRVVLTGDHTLYAHWRLHGYAVAFDANGGVGEMVPVARTVGAAAALPPAAFRRAGHDFAGWALSPDGEAAFADGAAPGDLAYGDGDEVTLYAVWEAEAVEAPVISPADGTVFRTASCTVTITCATKGATVYCSTTGRTPRPTEANRYTGPFEVTGTTTVIAYAVKGERESELAEATLVYVEPEPLTLANALDERKLAGIATGGDAAWAPVADASAKAGESVARSGAVGVEQSTWLEATVQGRGTLTFWWKTSCEPDSRGRYTYDHVTFTADGEERAKLDGETDWRQVSVTFETDGPHTLRWTYSTDDYEASGYQDCAWVDGVSWTGAAAPAAPGVVGDEGATVTGDAEGGFTVTPGAGAETVEVTVPDGLDAAKVTVEVPPTVKTVKAPTGVKVKVMRDGHDITAFLDIPKADASGAVDLASATVKDEIAREPLDTENGAEIHIDDPSEPMLKTAPTKPGLVYTLREGATLDAMKDGDWKVGDGAAWTPSVTVKGGTSGFYTIRVSKE